MPRTAERLFSVMRRVKNYLRTTTTSHSVMLLHVHREHADTLDINILLNDFVSGSMQQPQGNRWMHEPAQHVACLQFRTLCLLISFACIITHTVNAAGWIACCCLLLQDQSMSQLHPACLRDGFPMNVSVSSIQEHSVLTRHSVKSVLFA